MKYIFTIPDRNSNRFRCEIYENGEYMKMVNICIPEKFIYIIKSIVTK